MRRISEIWKLNTDLYFYIFGHYLSHSFHNAMINIIEKRGFCLDFKKFRKREKTYLGYSDHDISAEDPENVVEKESTKKHSTSFVVW